MQFSLLALATLVTVSSAHMILEWPPQWQGAPASSPLEPDGSNFPCQGAIPDMHPTANFTAGANSELKIQGSAAHGGGSGQLAVTLDFPPTKSSVWYVLHSFIGEHPFKVEGNFPADPSMHHPAISWVVPTELASGVWVFSWNWNNKVGNREDYMKCATIYVNSNHSDRGRVTELPTAFRANSGNGCIVPENVNGIAYKNPGKYVTTAPGITPVPIDCDPSQPGGYNAGTNLPTSGGSYGGASEGSAAGSDEVPPAPPANLTYDSPPPKESPNIHVPVVGGPECIEGTVTCNPDNTWSQCGSGRNQLQGKVTPGMVCKDGIFSGANAKVKREVRFSTLHKRFRH